MSKQTEDWEMVKAEDAEDGGKQKAEPISKRLRSSGAAAAAAEAAAEAEVKLEADETMSEADPQMQIKAMPSEPVVALDSMGVQSMMLKVTPPPPNKLRKMLLRLIVALDDSGSMGMDAQPLSAIHLLNNLVYKLLSEGLKLEEGSQLEIGIVAFCNDATLKQPLTLFSECDAASWKPWSLNNKSRLEANDGRTNLDAGLQLALQSFPDSVGAGMNMRGCDYVKDVVVVITPRTRRAVEAFAVFQHRMTHSVFGYLTLPYG